MSECPICKFDNPPSRRFCQNCGSAVVSAPKGPAQPPATDKIATLTAELQLARQQEELAQQEKERLGQLLDARENELKSVREENEHMAASLTRPPDAGHTVIEELQQQLAETETDKQRLTQELVTARQQTQSGSSGGGSSPRKRVGLVVGGLVLASVTALGGFKFGQIDPDKSHREKQQALTSQLATEQGRVQDLQSQLNSARQNVDQLTTQVSTRAHEAQDATGKLSKLQHDLNVAQASVAERTNGERQVKQELQAARQNVNQLNQDLAIRATQIQALQQVVQRHNALLNYSPKSGTITWQGERTKDKDKAFDIAFQPGRVVKTDSSTRTRSLSGELPGVPVIVRSLDKDVFVVVPPDETNGWRQMTIHIEGKKSKAQIYWHVPPWEK